MLAAEPVQWIAVTTTDDDLGDDTETAAEPVELMAVVAGRSSDETADNNQPGVITALTLYLRGTDVVPSASDRFIVRGRLHQVDGEAHRWGRTGVEVPIKRTGARP
jgi:head-tail adaptor